MCAGGVVRTCTERGRTCAPRGVVDRSAFSLYIVGSVIFSENIRPVPVFPDGRRPFGAEEQEAGMIYLDNAATTLHKYQKLKNP